MKIVYYLVFWIGYFQYRLFGRNSTFSYLAFRKLYGITNGQLNERLSSKISSRQTPYVFPDETDGICGHMDQRTLHEVVDKIKEEGYYIFENKMSEDLCNRLVTYALDTPAMTIPPWSAQPYLKFDPQNPKAPVYRFQEQDILKNAELRNILFDTNFMRIAQQYLECKPLNNSCILWWSSVFEKSASSRAAQLFHYDMDHPKFIKFFIYLTDVDAKAGPHCFVRGSHVDKPKALRSDVRFSDEEVQKHYPASEIVEIEGTKGTIIAVDTSGIHKGKVPEVTERLILQVEFVNSFFGQKVNKPIADSSLSAYHKEVVEKYAPTFQRIKWQSE